MQEGIVNTGEAASFGGVLKFLPSVFSPTHVAMANIAISAFDLYQMPIFKNMITLSYGVVNTIAYARGTNSYLKGASFTLIASSAYEAYKGEFMPLVQGLTSHLLFIQTPQIMHTYLADNIINQAKSAYIYCSFFYNMYLAYENNYGSNSVRHAKKSYDAWENLADKSQQYTQEIQSWIQGKFDVYRGKAEEIGNLIKYGEWEKCADPLEKSKIFKGLSHKEISEYILKICDITDCKKELSKKNLLLGKY